MNQFNHFLLSLSSIKCSPTPTPENGGFLKKFVTDQIGPAENKILSS